MIFLADLTTDEKAEVLQVNAEGELKQRLASFGLRKNSFVKIKLVTILKRTMEVEVGNSMIALRFEEAQKIKVKKI